jgi:SAM-dependent methyltransferase
MEKQSPFATEMVPVREKIAIAGVDHVREVERHLRFATDGLGAHLPPGARVLDFGCGIGIAVSILLAKGYDAFGVDVREYWGREFDYYPLAADRPSAELAARLKLLDLADYRLPFEDGTFDFCFSHQVFEHIFDYATTMSEIVRVLKPGAISVHSFPGPNYLLEGHLRLPFPWLCYSRSYLTLCAWIAWICGAESDWRRRVRTHVELMRFNNYPTKAELRRIAHAAGADIRFAEVEEFMFRQGGRLKMTLLEWLHKIKMDRVAVQVAGLVMLQRYMILSRAS